MLYFIQESKAELIDTIFLDYKSSYKELLSKAWAIDDYIGKDKNIKFRELQYYTYPIWLSLFIDYQSNVLNKTRESIIEEFELEELRKCFGCFSIDIDITINSIEFNQILDNTGVLEGDGGVINSSAIGSTFSINGGVVGSVITEEEQTSVNLLEEINKGTYKK